MLNDEREELIAHLERCRAMLKETYAPARYAVIDLIAFLEARLTEIEATEHGP